MTFEELAEVAMAFVVPLRMAAGFDEAQVQRFREAARAYLLGFADSDTIPKVAASLFLELGVAIDTCQALYPEDTERRISNAAAELIVDVSQLLATPRPRRRKGRPAPEPGGS